MEPEKSENNRSFLNNHLTLLALVILLSGGLYLFLGNPTTILAGVVSLVLAHIAIATGILLLVRGWLTKVFQKHLGSSPSQNHKE